MPEVDRFHLVADDAVTYTRQNPGVFCREGTVTSQCNYSKLNTKCISHHAAPAQGTVTHSFPIGWPKLTIYG